MPGPTRNFMKIKTEEKKDFIDYQRELLEGTLSPFFAWFCRWPTTKGWKPIAVFQRFTLGSKNQLQIHYKGRQEIVGNELYVWESKFEIQDSCLPK